MGWIYGFMVYKVKPVVFGVKTYSVLSSGTDARQFLLLNKLLGVSMDVVFYFAAS